MGCNHQKSSYKDVYQYDDWDTGLPVYERELVVQSTCEDISTHCWRCTQCGKIGYYSQAARDFYEDDVKNEIVEMSNYHA